MKETSRRTSKIWLAINNILGWGVIYYSIHAGLGDVATYALGFLTTIYGLYTGVGHLDYRQILRMGGKDVGGNS
jgi:hypothetical protein